MRLLELIVLLFFAGFFLSAITRIVSMLERKQVGQALERDRLLFFFFPCLMLVCLLPLWIFDLLSRPVLVSNLCVVLANGVGFVLTYSRVGEKDGQEQEQEAEEEGVRAYQVYYQGKPYGVVTREGFGHLMEYELVKKQRTVELVDDYQQQARKQGVKVVLLQNQDGSQTLIKVEVPGN